MNALIARWRDYVEEKRFQPDLSRAARCTAGFLGPIIAALWWNLPVEATYAAMAAQVIALVDVRGSYPLRLSLLLAMITVLAGAAWLGGAAGIGLGAALGATLILMLVGVALSLALHWLARGGVYLAGGMAAKLMSGADNRPFIHAFLAKREHTELMKDVPVFLITAEDLGLRGALALAIA